MLISASFPSGFLFYNHRWLLALFPLPLPTRPPPPSSPTQPYTAQRPAARVTGVWESLAEPAPASFGCGAET